MPLVDPVVYVGFESLERFGTGDRRHLQTAFAS